jgi:hypothetical protein
MIEHKPTGWNTWDYRGFNRFCYLRQGELVCGLHYAIWDDQVPPPTPDSKQIGKLTEHMRWEHATRLGPKAALGLPADLEFVVDGTPFRAAAWLDDEVFRLVVEPLADTHKRVVFILDAPDGAYLKAADPHNGTFAKNKISLEHATWPQDYFVKIAAPYAIAPIGSAATIAIKPAKAKRPDVAAHDAPGTVERYGALTLTGAGALADAPQAMTQAVMWNTLFDFRRHLVSSPVSRDWCYDWRGVLTFCWDTYLVGAFIAYESEELARLNFETVNRGIDEIGHVPNYFMAHGAASLDRSMPPIGSYLILKTQRTNPDKKFLRTAYKQLVHWHGFWKRHRDGNQSGLFSWGSNAEPYYEYKEIEPYNGIPRHTRQSAMYESGLDNSPMFDDVEFDEASGCLKLDDVALSSYFAMDCEMLAEMAELVGKQSDAKGFRAEHAEVAERINALLWDDARGIYCNRHWDGRLSDRWAPTSFFPLIAGVAPRERAERMVREHLLRDSAFWGRYVIPSISRSDPAYPDNDYWRGRIWGPFNFLVGEALKRYRLDDVAAELAEKSLAMFMENWRQDGGIYENYNADTGEGADVWNAARLYHWGGLLAFLGMQELVDVEPWGYFRFGSLKFPSAGLKNVRIGGHSFAVTLGDDHLTVERDGERFLACRPRAIVRLPLQADDETPIEISTVAEHGELVLADPDESDRPARLNQERLLEPAASDAGVVYRW